MQEYLDNKAKRGLVYTYPIKAEDLGKIPRFNDSNFRYFIVRNAYNIWNKINEYRKYSKNHYIRDFEKTWKLIANQIYSEIEENLDGVELPYQMGILYVGTPPNKTFFNLINLKDYKYIIWGSKIKYFNRKLKYYYFHTVNGRFKNVYKREDYYKTAKEKISNFKLY